MLGLINFLLLGLLAQSQPGAPPDSKKSQEFQEQRHALTFTLSTDGHIDLTVRETDRSTGKMVEKNYKADSIEEFKKKYPEVAKRYSIDRFASAGPLPGPGSDEFAKNFEEWKKKFDERWFWDRHHDGDLEKWLEDLPKSAQSGELEKWLGEQRQLFEKFRGMETPPGADSGKSEHPGGQHVLGVLVAPVGDTLASQLGFDKPQGVVIAAVQKDSPADKAGLQINDVVVKISGKSIPDVAFFRREVQSSSTPFDLDVIRRGKHQILRIQPSKHEDKSSD